MRFPEDVPVLSDGQVTLRAHSLEDVDAIIEQCQDQEMRRWSLVPVPYSRVDAVAFVRSRPEGWESRSSCSFAIEAYVGAGPTRFAGTIDLRCKGEPGVAGVAFAAHPVARGHGVMTTAVRLLADWAFAECGVERLGWVCIAGNTASWRVAWRNGFRFEGSTRRAQPQRGNLLDAWNGSLLASDSREPKSRWLPRPRLTDGTVVLRAVSAADETRYLETVLDPETDRWLSEVPLARDQETFQARVTNRELGPSLGQGVDWAIADARTDEYVGGVGLFGIGGLDHETAEVGYRSHPGVRGRGFVSAGVRLAVAHAFTSVGEGGLGLSRIALGAGAGNSGSQAVARACGFTVTGRDRSCYRLNDGTVVDLVRFDLLLGEWPA